MQGNDETYKKLNNYSDKEELWKKIFLCSIISSLIITMVSFVFDFKYKVILCIGILCIAWIVFSFITLLTYHNLYESLLVDIARKNNTIDSITSSSNKNNQASKSRLKINYVLEGKWKDKEIYHFSKNNFIEIIGGSSFEKERISSYTVIDETNKDQYSIWKGALGVALLGDFGAVAGIGGKKKKEYLIAIEWKDGEKSLICIDDEYYKVLVKSMF